MGKKPKFDRPWTEFRAAELTEASKELMLRAGGSLPRACWKNSRYEVWVYEFKPEDPALPPVVQLSVKRLDRAPVRRWRDLQRVKNEVAGPEVEACEIFPAESRLVDTSNQFHLWCLPPGVRFPFGYRERLVMEGDGEKSRQAPFEDGERPADCVKAPARDSAIVEMADRLRAEHEAREAEAVDAENLGTAAEVHALPEPD